MYSGAKTHSLISTDHGITTNTSVRTCYSLKMRILIAVGIILAVLSTAESVSRSCKGTVNFPIIYEDGQVKNVSVNGDSAMDSDANTPITLQRLHFKEDGSFAGENGIEIGRYHAWLIPGGRSGGHYVKSFNYTTETWNNVDVYCPPWGLSYRQESDEVVGFCTVNTTYGPITCVPYFTLRLRNGQWADVSRPGSCSQHLSTANISNPVILQSDSDYEYDETRLYFAERGTNRLHEVSLSTGEAKFYDTDATLKIDHLVPVRNATFLGLRVVCHVENSFDFYHRFFVWQLDSTQQETGFVEEFVVTTESIAFDSYNLDYLVTFNAIRDTVEFEGARSNDFQSLTIPVLDEPIHCQNVVGPSTQFLICLARNGHLALLININDGVTLETIESESKIIKIGVLTENTVYLLNDQQKLSVYLITPTVTCLGIYGVRANIDFVITSASGNINCTDIENASDVDKSHSSDSDHVLVIAVVIPIAVIIAIVLVVIAFIKRKEIKKYITFCQKKGDINGYKDHENKDIPKGRNSDHLHDRNDVTIKEHKPINDSNHNGDIQMRETTQPASPDNRDTGARNIEELPTDSVDPCQEVGTGEQPTAMVGFPNPDAGRVQNENNGDDTQCIEQPTEQCIQPRECTEYDEENLPLREEPIGHTCK